MVRHAAWTLTRYALKADGQTSLLMSKDYHSEVAKLTGLESRNDLMNILLAIRGSTFSARASRRKPRGGQRNLESVKAVLCSSWELRVHTEFDAPLTRQKYHGGQNDTN